MIFTYPSPMCVCKRVCMCGNHVCVQTNTYACRYVCVCIQTNVYDRPLCVDQELHQHRNKYNTSTNLTHTRHTYTRAHTKKTHKNTHTIESNSDQKKRECHKTKALKISQFGQQSHKHCTESISHTRTVSMDRHTQAAHLVFRRYPGYTK